MISLCRVLFCVKPFIPNLSLVFIFFFILVVSFSQKLKGLGLLFDFCVLFVCGKT